MKILNVILLALLLVPGVAIANHPDPNNTQKWQKLPPTPGDPYGNANQYYALYSVTTIPAPNGKQRIVLVYPSNNDVVRVVLSGGEFGCPVEIEPGICQISFQEGNGRAWTIPARRFSDHQDTLFINAPIFIQAFFYKQILLIKLPIKGLGDTIVEFDLPGPPTME